MTRQPPNAVARTGDSWPVGGEEAEAVLELARFTKEADAGVDALSERRFLTAFRGEVSAREARRAGASFGRVAAYGLAFAGAVALALLVFNWGARNGDQALSYRVSDGPAVGGAVIDAKKGPIAVTFSDGTAVTLENGSSAHILETTHRGAHLRLDAGRVALDVVPHVDRGDWAIDAGPFKVRVTGTAFTVEWRASDGFFQVAVSRGHVVVDGEGQHRELSAGESFRHVDPQAGPDGAAVDANSAVVGEPALDRAPSPVPSASATRDALDSASWTRLVGMGRFDAVLAAAEQRGVPVCLDSCSLDDLKALADAARLSRKVSLAEQALLAQRARFAGSSDAKAAAFVLGRLTETAQPARASQWYSTYLSESPKGRFASDAMGRKMVLMAASDRASAIPLAVQYLERFPSGPYASHARSIVEAEQVPR